MMSGGKEGKRALTRDPLRHLVEEWSLLHGLNSRTWELLTCKCRHNILFGRAMDVGKYEAAVDACGLSADLRAMPARDSTLVGEQGCRLSGGQRVRVALARALYQACPHPTSPCTETNVLDIAGLAVF